MVVPIRATDSNKKDLVATKCGQSVLAATSCQFGLASTAAMG